MEKGAQVIDSSGDARVFSVLPTRLKNGEQHANFSAAALSGHPRLFRDETEEVMGTDRSKAKAPQKPPKGARGTLYTRSARLFSHAENAGAAEFVLTQSSFSHGHLRPLNQVKCRSRTENNGKQIRFEMA